MEQLKQSLENLHNELKNAKNIDDDSLKALHQLIADIGKILENNEQITGKETPKLLAPLREAAKSFEVSHPGVTGAINIVISSLSNIGV